jgi:DNA polymerase-4
VATVKLLAKLASEDAKPDGYLVVPAGSELDYLHPKAVRALWGVGEATHARLEELGVATIGDLAALPSETLAARLGPSLGAHLAALARAEDPRGVETPGEAKSISVEQTYETDLKGRPALERELLRLADRLSRRLRRAAMEGRTVALKVRFADFTTITRSRSTTAATAVAHDLFEAALALLERAAVGERAVRLLGLAAEQLAAAAAPHQMQLGGSAWSDVEEAVEAVRRRFGDGAVAPARLVEPPAPGTGGDGSS